MRAQWPQASGTPQERPARHPEQLRQLAEVLLSQDAAQQLAEELPFSALAGPCLQALLAAVASDRCAASRAAQLWSLLRATHVPPRWAGPCRTVLLCPAVHRSSWIRAYACPTSPSGRRPTVERLTAGILGATWREAGSVQDELLDGATTLKLHALLKDRSASHLMQVKGRFGEPAVAAAACVHSSHAYMSPGADCAMLPSALAPAGGCVKEAAGLEPALARAAT